MGNIAGRFRSRCIGRNRGQANNSMDTVYSEPWEFEMPAIANFNLESDQSDAVGTETNDQEAITIVDVEELVPNIAGTSSQENDDQGNMQLLNEDDSNNESLSKWDIMAFCLVAATFLYCYGFLFYVWSQATQLS